MPDVDIEVLDITSSMLSVIGFAINNLVIINAYVTEYTASDPILTVPEGYRPSETISIGRAWMMTDSSNWGSKEFTLNTSGVVQCNGNIYRGQVVLMYAL